MATFKVPYFKWRNGRPRWEPGPGVRALGFAGVDLKDGTGAWLSESAAIARAQQLNAQVAARRSGGMPPRRERPKRLPHCCAALWDDYKTSLRWRTKLAPSTKADYEGKAKIWLADFGTVDVVAIQPSHIYNWWEEMCETRGHAMANATVAVARLALSYGRKKGWLQINPAKGLDLDGLEPRQVMWEDEEIAHLVAIADTEDFAGDGRAWAGMGRRIAHAFVVALHTGQRRGDVLDLEMPQVRGDGWADFKQSKTGAFVSIPFSTVLAERIAAIRAERLQAGVVDMTQRHLILHPSGEAFRPSTFSIAWRRLRARAASEMPSIAGKTFADLRDTAVTRLALAGCSVFEIADITGHAVETVHVIMKHYYVKVRGRKTLARSAIDKLDAWMKKERIAV